MEKPDHPYTAVPIMPPIIPGQPAPADLDLAGRLEALQQRLREEQAALPKPLSTVHTYVSLRMGYALQQIEFARVTLVSQG